MERFWWAPGIYPGKTKTVPFSSGFISVTQQICKFRSDTPGWIVQHMCLAQYVIKGTVVSLVGTRSLCWFLISLLAILISWKKSESK